MFFSRKLEAFMAVVENGSLSKAARVMNRTTPPIAKSIKDFETILGKRLFKREKFGMTLTKDGFELYNDLRELYLQEKEITKKHFTGHISNEANIYYDWGKEGHLINLYHSASKHNTQVNIFRFNSQELDDIVDYDGNTLILSSEIVISERFSLLKQIEHNSLGIYCQRSLYQLCQENIIELLRKYTWLCDPALYKSPLMAQLIHQVGANKIKISIRQMDNTGCCVNFIQQGDFIGLSDQLPKECRSDEKMIFLPLDKLNINLKCYIYKSKAHSSVLNRFISLIEQMT
ncbi:LysR family transcriptional regulator [Moellerella wisconsensis]|uniref:Putative LysR family transcriptional regulator n=1 Tax=Moellerella wisconsensis ATCC 35017 TaxID=1354267 RepID=A0A0N0Z8I7_9GAMM|nr:LysR family transcriptional regulator [Moellerella wisconsensis]KPD02714.1 putative LysR family transcriptional regulator [Moellerella wisconsensis ATCC 35017]